MVYEGRRLVINSKRIKRALAVLCTLAIFAGTLGCGSQYVLTTAFEQHELMRINNKSCSLNQMMLYLTTIQNKYEAVYGEKIWQQSDDGVKLEDKVKDMVLAKVAQVLVMNLMAESYKLELDESEIEKVKAVSENFYNSLNEAEREILDLSGDDIYKFYYEYALADKVYDYVIKDVNDEISDDEARTITVQQILIKTYALDQDGKRLEYSKRAKKEALEKAELVRNLLIESDESFESLAAKYNEGDEMTYTFGRGEIGGIFEETAFSLDKDAISEVIETDLGYHVLKCVSDFDLDQTQLNKISILEKRKEELFDETYDAFLETLTKTLNDKLYESITFIHDDRVTTTSFFDVSF